MNIKQAHEAFCQYQETIKNYRPLTIQSYKTTMKVFLKVLPHIHEIEEVCFLDLQKFFYWGRTERDWKPATFITHHKQLNVFFKWAVKKQLIDNNPVKEIEKPRLEKKLPSRLTKEEAFKLMEMAANLPYGYPFLNYRNHAIFATFLFTGLRKSELLNLRCSDVDLERMVIFVRQGKGNKDRMVPIPHALKRVLEKYLPERERLKKTCGAFFVSLNRDSGITKQALRRLVRKLKDATGIDFYLHKLRHTFATMAYKGSKDIMAVQQAMGHRHLDTTLIYTHLVPDQMKNALEQNPINLMF